MSPDLLKALAFGTNTAPMSGLNAGFGRIFTLSQQKCWSPASHSNNECSLEVGALYLGSFELLRFSPSLAGHWKMAEPLCACSSNQPCNCQQLLLSNKWVHSCELQTIQRREMAMGPRLHMQYGCMTWREAQSVILPEIQCLGLLQISNLKA